MPQVINDVVIDIYETQVEPLIVIDVPEVIFNDNIESEFSV